MPVIYVRAKAGRRVTDVPGGKIISSDEFVPVRETGRIRRYIEVHEDLEERDGKPKAAKAPKGEAAVQAARTAAVQEAAAQEAARVAAQEEAAAQEAAAAKPVKAKTDEKK